MSFASGNTSIEQPSAPKALGVQEDRTSSNEAGRPVPYLCGRNRIGVIWLCEPFNVKATPVTSQSGGKGGRASTRGYNYFASIAALLCHGPLDEIHEFYFNNERVWQSDPPVTRSGDSTTITIEGHGTLKVYWGTSTQTADGLLAASGASHPPYRRQAYLVFEDLFLGFNQTSLPNIEVVAARYVDPAWMTADANIDGDANPVAFITDLLQSEVYGLGLPDTALDTAALDAVATTLATEGLGLSPTVTRVESVTSLITKALEYIDGYRYWDGQGRFTIGLIREPGSVPVTLDEDDLVEPPDIEAQDYSEVKTVTNINFTDRDRAWKKNYLPYRDARSRLSSGVDEPATIDRPWITSPEVAATVLAATGRANALPATTGTLQVLRASAESLTQGSPFYLSYSRHGISNLLCRVTSKRVSSPQARSVTLEFRLDRAWLNAAAADLYVPPVDVPPTPAEPVIEPIAAQAIYELPYELTGTEAIVLAPLVARPNTTAIGYDIHQGAENALASTNGVPLGPGSSLITEGGSLLAELAAVSDTGLFYGMRVQFSFSGEEEEDMLNAFAQDRLIATLNAGAYSEIVTVVEMRLVSGAAYEIYGYRARKYGASFGWPTLSSVKAYASAAPIFNRAYSRIGNHDRFSKHGTLNETYPATTGLLDSTVGLDVTLDQADTTLASVSLDEALRDSVLILLGDEIISMTSVTLVAAGHYRVFGLRGRFDSRPVVHPAGSEVWIVENSSDASSIKQMRLQQGYGTMTRWKFQPRFLSGLDDLANAQALSFRLRGRAQFPRSPANLSHSGDGRHPVYATGEDLDLTWTLSSQYRAAFWDSWGQTLAASLTSQIRLKFYTTGGELKRTVDLAFGSTAYTYSNATLQADFGGEPDIRIEAWGKNGGWLSLFSDQLVVYAV